jgi:hypothetical protein
MKTTITKYDFHHAFEVKQRQNQFSYEALDLLFEYLEQLEEDTETEFELDVVAICCEFSENHYEYIASNYNVDLSELDDEDDKKQAVEDYLQENSSLVGWVGDCCVYQQF